MDVEYCSSWATKTQGLQGRNTLAADSVLLFTCIGSNQIFHMRNVKFPILIAAIDDSGVVLKKSILRPEVDIFKTPEGTAHVLEAHTNFLNANRVEAGEVFPNLKMGEVYAKLSIRM